MILRNKQSLLIKVSIALFLALVVWVLFVKLQIFHYRDSRVTGIELLSWRFGWGLEPRYKESFNHRNRPSENDVLGYELRPDFYSLYDGVDMRLERVTHIRINSQGFRDYEYAVEKPEGIFRIIVIGDAFTFGQGVEMEETYAKVLEKRLNDRMDETSFEVLNFGVPGYLLFNSAEQFQSKALKYTPDLLIVGITLADDLMTPKGDRLTGCNQNQDLCRSRIEVPFAKLHRVSVSTKIPVLTVHLLENRLKGGDILKELSEHYDFHYLPLTSNLELRNAFDGSLMYIPMDGHFSAYGNNITASEIYDYLFKNGMINIGGC